MTTITKERIELFIKNPLENGLTRGEQMELALIALASLESVAAPVVPEEMTPKQASRSYCGEVRGYRDGWNACCAAMLQGKSEQPQNAQQNIPENIPGGNSPVTPDGWIPVSERMPEPYEYVLVTDGFDGCEVMRVNTDGYWGPAKSLYPGSITHWMPLPAAPQQEVK
ncbi:TPA: DUF551 domain-containing protein [Escherichia coli]|nr:DUF551 domain-containing protein [Escherichia coli]